MSDNSLIACSRMYNVSPEVTEAWVEVFAYLSDQTEIPLKVMFHAFPSPIEELWAMPDLGCVLMCGYPYARANPRPTLLAAPVPSLPHYGDKPIYFSYLLVAEDSPYQTIEDTFGGRISWTIENSQSGFNAVRSFLLPYRTEDRPSLYRESVGPIGTFTVGVEGMRRGEIDVVPIDSFSYDLMLHYTPESLAGTRVLATTPPAPFPPLIASHDIDPGRADAMREVLLEAHKVPQLRECLETIMLNRFEAVRPEYYESTLEQAAVAEAAGYLMPS